MVAKKSEYLTIEEARKLGEIHIFREAKILRTELHAIERSKEKEYA